MLNKFLKIRFGFSMAEFLMRLIASIYIRTVFIPENGNNYEQSTVFPFSHKDIPQIPEDGYVMVNVMLRKKT